MSEIVDGRLMIARNGEHFCLTRQDPYRICGPAKSWTTGILADLPHCKTPGNLLLEFTTGENGG